MDQQILTNISKILERDSKSTTYKFALLRGTIELIGDNSPFIEIKGDRAHFPLGLLIEKWLLYYYPIIESDITIPQISGSASLAFAGKFKELTSYFQLHGGFSAFYNDLNNKGIPTPIATLFKSLVEQIGRTIAGMPMKYIGRSISADFYSIFQYEKASVRQHANIILDSEYLIHRFGTFSIPLGYFEAFKVIGPFISGQDALLFKWAKFSVMASGKMLSVNQVLNEVLKSPITSRDILDSKKLYKSILQNEGNVRCVWSGEKLTKYDIDHIIPFSIWKNNDLWNLLPAHSKINNHKRDKIPTVDFIESQRELIIHYWEILFQGSQIRFQKELQVSLLGYAPLDDWKNVAIEQLKKKCDYLITVRGFQPWEIA